jgi:glycine cleavage system H protein
LAALNEQLLEDPSAINSDKYGVGWLFEIRGGGEGLLTAEQYLEHLQSVWKVTMRLLRDQQRECGGCGNCNQCVNSRGGSSQDSCSNG